MQLFPIHSGKWLKIHFEGGMKAFQEQYTKFHKEWLPAHPEYKWAPNSCCMEWYQGTDIQSPEEDLRTDFLDFCFEHMMDVEEFPGIQSVCMKLAFRMCKFYPELMDELKRTLEAMEIDYYKPAVKCVRSRILSGRLK